MKEKRAIFINTASQVVVRFVTLIFALISVKLVTNYLGPSGTGEYNTITTYINFFIVIADLGLFSITVREIAKNPGQEQKILSNVFIIRLVTAILASLVAAALVFSTRYNWNIKLGTMVASFYIFFNLISSIYDMILQARLKMQFSALAEFISKLVALIALFIIIKMNGNFLWVISTITLTAVLVLIIKWFFAQRFLRFKPGYDRAVAGWIFAAAWPMGIVFILNNLFFKIDTLILFSIKGAAEVGIYSVAYRVLEVTAFVGAYFANSLKPVISRNIAKNKDYVSAILTKAFLIMVVLSLPITIISLVFAKEIIIFLSNEEFIAGSNALILLSFTLPFIYLDILLGELLVANDERRLLIRIAVFILSFNLILNLILIPRYSFMGAAVVTCLSEAVLFFINLHYTRKIVPYKLDTYRLAMILIIGLLTLILSLLLKTLAINFIILMALSCLIYASLFYVFKIVSFKSLQQMIKE